MTSPLLATSTPRRRKWLYRVASYIMSGLFLLTTVLLVLAYQPIAGYQAHLILSDSMRPRLSAGSVILTKGLAADQYQEGDIITFIRPGPEHKSITHRLHRLYIDAQGITRAESKGDANPLPDPWVVGLSSIQGKLIFSLVGLGYLLKFLTLPWGFFSVVALSFIFLIIPEIFSYRELFTPIPIQPVIQKRRRQYALNW